MKDSDGMHCNSFKNNKLDDKLWVPDANTLSIQNPSSLRLGDLINSKSFNTERMQVEGITALKTKSAQKRETRAIRAFAKQEAYIAKCKK